MNLSNLIDDKGMNDVLVEQQTESDIDLDGENSLKHSKEQQYKDLKTTLN